MAERCDLRADVAYGPGPRETLDLIFPDRVAPDAPLHMFVHGGYWRSGEKANYRLPLALDCGDRVELLATGAYVTTYASQAFNGFRPLAEHYV